MTNQVYVYEKNPGCLIQLLWFLLVGWWAGPAWVGIAWLLMLTIIGLPVGISMIHTVPKVIALRSPLPAKVVDHNSRRIVSVPQVNFLVRALYFLLVGWWASGLWMALAYALAVTIIGLPVAFWMFDVTPTVLTLKQ